MNEKDLELLLTLDAPEAEEEDPHYQLELENTRIENSTRGQVTLLKLANNLVGKRKDIE